MLKRPIPPTGEVMPVIGLVTCPAFDVAADGAPRRSLPAVLRLLLDSGGRMIDSSPMYGLAEAATGNLLAELGARPRAFIATKVWITGRERWVEQMRGSARLLRAEVIDLIKIHNLVDRLTHLATLRRMEEEGRVCSPSLRGNPNEPLRSLNPLQRSPRVCHHVFQYNPPKATIRWTRTEL
jgi:diketogulonate reductase-like aldo/keto reductase